MSLILEGQTIDVFKSIRWEGVAIHHSATPDGRTHDWNQIDYYHTHWRYEGNNIPEAKARALISQGKQGVESPMVDIGYNFGEEYTLDPTTGESNLIFNIGRRLDISGGHTKELNSKLIGICIVGNFDVSPPKTASIDMLIRVCRVLRDFYGFKPYPKYETALPNSVMGHSDSFVVLGRAKTIPEAWKIKTCPGKLFPLGYIKREVAK